MPSLNSQREIARIKNVGGVVIASHEIEPIPTVPAKRHGVRTVWQSHITWFDRPRPTQIAKPAPRPSLMPKQTTKPTPVGYISSSPHLTMSSMRISPKPAKAWWISPNTELRDREPRDPWARRN